MSQQVQGVDTSTLETALGLLKDTTARILQQLENKSVAHQEQPQSPAPVPDTTKPLRRSLPEVHRSEQVTVYIKVIFLKLGEIDTIQERFTADALIQARWREPSLDGRANDTEIELEKLTDWWSPKLFVENVLGDIKESSWCLVNYDSQGEAMLLEKRRVKGTFFEQMELMDYPFDTQELTLTVSTERGEHEVQLVADPSEISSVNVQSFVEEQEWSLHHHIKMTQKVTTDAFRSARHKHPALSVSCSASRRSRFFIWNIILVMVFLGGLVFTTFSVDHALVQNRLQLSFILLLATITFKFVVTQTLPKVSYLTFMDKYILTSQFITCTVCVWHAIVSQISDDHSYAKQIDIIALVILAALFLVFNCTFFLIGMKMVKRKQAFYRKKEEELQARVGKLEAQKAQKMEGRDKSRRISTKSASSYRVAPT